MVSYIALSCIVQVVLAAAAKSEYSTWSSKKTPFFILAGDSTTAINGGWGDGLLANLKSPAFGVNIGRSGATTKSFIAQEHWKNVTDHVTQYVDKREVYVTISFGHNDQKPENNVSTTEYEENLINFGKEIQKLGATPLFVSSLTRRAFPQGQPNNASDSLARERLLLKWAAQKTYSIFVDLNRNSLDYVNQIGRDESWKFNLADTTHLGVWGEVVFGRMVADLIQIAVPQLDHWINENKTMSANLWLGLPPP